METLVNVPQRCVEGGISTALYVMANIGCNLSAQQKDKDKEVKLWNITQQLKSRRGSPLCMDREIIASHNS